MSLGARRWAWLVIMEYPSRLLRRVLLNGLSLHRPSPCRVYSAAANNLVVAQDASRKLNLGAVARWVDRAREWGPGGMCPHGKDL